VDPDATTVAAPRRSALRLVAAPLWCTALAFLPLACDPAGTESIGRAYWPRSAHQAYGHSLAQARLTESALGQEWLAAAERALASPVVVDVEYDGEGRFDAGAAVAWGYRITGRPGQRLAAVIRTTATERVEVFIDLFRLDGGNRVHVASAAPLPVGAAAGAEQRIEWQVLEPTDYVVRIQPELLRAGSVHVTIRTEPLLAFPVTGLDTGAIQSGFGAERDGGTRVHRGVDIFAARGTDAVAAVDGWVTRVDATRRGGNVVWLTPLFGDLRLYYAHLDTQVVEAGQFVRRGDIIGTVGNTGNAATTPPHLHFGVYVRRAGQRGGATDPVSFLRSLQ
jgi:murein DD-endopeptidase MepM/ murein hydrolase activator NlpD